MTNRSFSVYRHINAFLVLALFASALTGCGSSDEGPKRYTLSGKATYANGKPIPAGEINFAPDSSQGNSGPGASARIKEGAYATEPGKGIIGGKHVVTIIGYDGVPFGESTDGKPLFAKPYETQVDFPKQDSTRDFAVP